MCTTSTLDLATLDGMLPERVEDTVVKQANRRLTPRHAQDIQQYLENRSNWLLGPMLLGIAPDAVEFEPYQDEAGKQISANFGELRVLTNRANTMRIFDGQHRRPGYTGHPGQAWRPIPMGPTNWLPCRRPLSR